MLQILQVHFPDTSRNRAYAPIWGMNVIRTEPVMAYADP